jgi:phosphatidate cytidylyltransferase
VHVLYQRLLLGPILILVLLCVCWLDQTLETLTEGALRGGLLFPLLLAVGVFGALELSNIFRCLGVNVSPTLTCISVGIGFGASSLTPQDVSGFSGIAVACTTGAAVLVGSLAVYSRHRTAQGVALAAAATLFAAVYLGFMGGFLIVLRKEYSAWLLLGLLLVTKSYDIGAYFSGRFFGRTKLIQWLSPGKTWEGLVGGLLVSTAIGIGAALLTQIPDPMLTVNLQITWWQGAIAGLCFGLVGQGGDLVASLLKRDAGLKDSSKVLPGFGGVLDVIDSPTVVAPVAYWLLLAFTPS